MKPSGSKTTSLTWFLFTLLTGLILLSASNLFAQAIGTTQIQGVVQDQTQAVIPGARVVVRNVATGVARELVTNEVGRYRAVNLQPGEYEITVEAPGFGSVKRSGVNAEVGSTATVDITLQVAAAAEVVTVTEAAPIAEPERTEYTATVSQVSVENLPINGRRWENFVLLTPTVQPDGEFGLVSYRGISGLYNNNMVDGADNNQAFFSEARGRTRTSYTVSQAAIKEFQVGISNFSAEYGRAAGGSVNAVTKGGGNAFHGEGFYFVRDDAFNATEAISKADGFEKLPERRQQFGFSMGGPVVRDQLFWFLNYDQQIRNFPGIAVDDRNLRDSAGRLFIDPSFALDEICDFTTVGQARCEGARQVLLNELGPFSRKGHNNVALGKLDWIINPSHTFAVQYNFHKWRSPNGIQTQDRTNDTPNANGFDGVRTDLLLFTLTSLPTTNTVNEFRFQFGRDNEFQRQNAPGPSVLQNSELDIDGGGMRDFLPRDAFPDEDRYQLTDNFSYVRGRHVLRGGFDINYVREDIKNLFRGGGVYDFRGFESFAMDVPLSGIPVFPDGSRTGKHYRDFRQAFDLTGGLGALFFTTTDWNFYVQDTWKVHPHVTLNFGLRYEYTDLPQPNQGIYSCVGAGTCPDFAGLPASLQTTAMHMNQDTNNFGPRVALAWDIGGKQKTVIRTGYGLYYGRTSNSALARGLFENNSIDRVEIDLFASSGVAPVFPNTFCTPALGTFGQTSTCTFPAGASGSTAFSLFTRDFVRPLIHMGELEIQHSITPNMSISASYLVSRGLRLPVFPDINFNRPAPTDTVTFIDNISGAALGTLPFYTGPRPISTFGTIIQAQSVGQSWYNAFVLRVQRRLSQGLQFDSHVTISKALDDGQNSFTFFANFPQFVDPFNRRLDYGESGFDIRKKWISSFYWDPPFEKIENDGLRKAFEGFLFSGIITLRDGRAHSTDLNGSSPRAHNATAFFTTNGSGGDDRVPWLGPNTATTTGFATLDFRVTREFRFGETKRAVFIWEAFNLFNHTNLVYSGFGDDAFDVVGNSRVGDARFIFVEPRSDFTPIEQLRTGASNTLSGPREMQFAFKFIW